MNDYLGMQAINNTAVCAPQQETIRERLQRQRKVHQEYLANVESALKFMDDNPNFENFHNLVSKIGF